MKPLTKTVVSRGGGIAARFAPIVSKPKKPGPPPEPIVKPKVAKPVAPTTKPQFDRVAYQRNYMRQWRAKQKAQQ